MPQHVTSVYSLAECMSIKGLVEKLIESHDKLAADLEGLRGQVRVGWTPDENLRVRH
jgi:hypothetical protein